MSNRNVISSIVGKQVPEFVRVDHPTFIAFLEAYFEWLEQTNPSYLNSPFDVPDVSDIDKTLDLFVDFFKAQYLRNFPEQLAVDQETQRPLDEQKLIKNIKAFYTNKGTEKSYEFLFRILYDTAVEFYYPKIDILRVSDGKWIRQKSLRTTFTKGNRLFETITKRIVQFDPDTNLTIASARVSNIVTYQLGSFEVAEIFVTNVNGEFLTQQPYYFTNSSGDFEQESHIHTVVQGISFGGTGIGSGYKVGDRIVFGTNTQGQGAKAHIAQVDSDGGVEKIVMDNFGVNYYEIPTFSVDTDTGTGFTGEATIGALCEYEGYFANNDGKISSNKVLQDNRYFQNYSYVLKTELTISQYRDAIKQLIHPAGLGFFGLVSIKRTLEDVPDSSNLVIQYEIPLIGHYAPYTFITFDDLRNWFRDPFTGATMGYDPDVHDPEIYLTSLTHSPPFGFPSLTGNPISSGIVPSRAISPLKDSSSLSTRRNPFYLIYQHPNKRITRPVYVEIPYELRSDFYGATSVSGASAWPEWLETDENRPVWYDSFSGTGVTATRMAQIQYSQLSEFRKIRIGSFLQIEPSEYWDSSQDDGTYSYN